MITQLQSKFYDASKINKKEMLFDRKALWVLLVPIIIEQLLNCLMGMVDSIMVSNVGSSAISAVSLVDSINTLVIQVFAAMATGATIICSQYIGKNDRDQANRAARQVVLTMTVGSISLMAILLIGREEILQLVFGRVEADVMANAMIYFLITVLSYPFIALFNAGASFYRASGNSKFPMKVSVISNVLNIVGNIIFIFGLHMGVAGAALSTLISRAFCAIVLFYFLRQPKQTIVMKNYLTIRPDFMIIGSILAIGVPAGIENGMFQFGKLAIQSTVSELGTTAIAAQAMTNTLEFLNGVAGMGIGIGLMTVVGQCIGAGRKEEAKYYIVKLTWYAEVLVLLSCIIIMFLAKPITILGGMETESAKMCLEMALAITIVKPLFWVLAFIPVYGMRAAGDVKFSMVVSTSVMWFCRVALSIFLCRVWGFGPMAVWIGMFVDWFVRAVIFTWRFRSGKWLKTPVIG